MMSIFPAGGAGLRSKTDDVMRNLFGRPQHDAQASTNPTVLTGPRVPRHSSAWKDLLKFLKSEQGLRILDIGPTSPTNINFLTTLGHGVYMADVVNEALRGNWMSAPDETGYRSSMWKVFSITTSTLRAGNSTLSCSGPRSIMCPRRWSRP